MSAGGGGASTWAGGPLHGTRVDADPWEAGSAVEITQQTPAGQRDTGLAWLWAAISMGRYDIARQLTDIDATSFQDKVVRRYELVRKQSNLWPKPYQDTARRAQDSIPADVFFDLLRSDLTDTEVLDNISAFQAFRVRERVETELTKLSEYTHLDRDTAAARSRSNVPTVFGPQLEELGFDPKTTVALSDAFGLTGPDWLQQIATAPERWFSEKVLDSVVMKKLQQISEAPARALDWLATQTAGHKTTAGQFLFSGIEEKAPAAYNVLSGTADAAKLFFLDTFVIFGKILKPVQTARGLGPITDANMIERGLRSMPVDKFVRWYAKAPDDLRSTGAMLRRGEQLGWSVEPYVWDKLASTPRRAEDVRRVLSQEARRGGMRSLPLFPMYTPLRDAAEKVLAPTVRAGRMTWGTRMDPNHPLFERYLRRYGDYVFEDDRMVDSWITRIMHAPSKGQRIDAISRFRDDGLKALAVREGATLEQAERALEAVRGTNPAWKPRTALYGFDDAGEKLSKIQLPFRQTHLDRDVPVFSYPEVLQFKTELGRAMGNRELGARALKRVDDLASTLMVPVIKGWIARPGLGAKQATEETFWLAGHWEYGRQFRREARQAWLNQIARIPFAGAPAALHRRAYGLTALDRMEVPQEILGRSQRAGYERFAGERLSVEVERELAGMADLIAKVDPHRWMELDPTNAAFTTAWYHVVNHQILQNPVSELLVKHWDEADNGVAVARAWLQTPDGLAYIRQFPRERVGPRGGRLTPRAAESRTAEIRAAEEAGTARRPRVEPRLETDDEVLERILRVELQDITRNIPSEVMPFAQAATTSGVPVSIEVLNGLPLDRRPEKIIGPAPINEVTTTEHNFAQIGTGLDKLAQKGFQGAAWILDEFSRRPGYRAAFRYEKTRLTRLRSSVADSGGNIRHLSDEILDQAANRYAWREMYRLDNPVEKSRADFWLKNVVLFSWAQASFMKRWARLGLRNPGYVSRLRMMVGAGEDLGFVERSEDGTLTFQLPVSPEFYTWMITREGEKPKNYPAFRVDLQWASDVAGVGAFTQGPFKAFGKVFLPPGIPFAAQIEPGFSPVLTVPVDVLVQKVPKLSWLRDVVVGGIGESWEPERGFMHNLLNEVRASWMADLSRAVTGGDGDRSYVGALREVVAWMELSDRDPHDKQNWDQADKLIRGMFALRALSKVFGPYSVNTVPFNIGAERTKLEELRAEHGMEEGTKRYLDEHEGSLILTTSTSEAVGVEEGTDLEYKVRFGLAPTVFAEEFVRDHPEMFDEYPDVAGLFTYTGDEDADKLDRAALRRQRLRGDRRSFSRPELYAKVNIQAADREYYDEAVPALERLEAAGYKREDLEAVRREVIAFLEEKYPGYAMYRTKWSERDGSRRRSIDQLREAVKDPAVREREDVQVLAGWLRMYDDSMTYAESLGLRSLQSKKLKQERESLAQLYRDLQSVSYSGVLYKAYTYLFQRELEDITFEGDETEAS